MAEAYNRLRSKLNRAIAAYLVSVGGDCGSVADILPANSRAQKSYPNTTAQATLSTPEAPLTGLRRIRVHISIKGSAVQTSSAPDPDAPRAAFDDRVAATYDALMQSDDGETLRATAEDITAAGRALATSPDATIAADNADMADFTCQGWYDAGEGDGEANAEGCDWEEILMFDALCSPSNVD